MLRIARLTDRTGRYYLGDLAEELAAVDALARQVPDRPRPGRWVGAGTVGLGLEGPVDADALALVLSGRNPEHGGPLRRHPTTVAGYDLVFAAPKSVSVLFGLGDELHAAAALDAHGAAVEAAVGYVTRRAASVRTCVGDDRRIQPVRGVIAARFDHGVSRALDPHLHSHVVMANMAQDHDGRWRALDGRGMDAHTRAAGAIYDAHLRHALTERTAAAWVRRVSGAYELAAVDPLVAGAFSGRQASIRQHLHSVHSEHESALAEPSHRARQVAWAATREGKATPAERAPEELRRRWRSRAADVGWGEQSLADALSGLRSQARAASVVDEHRFASALHEGTLHAGATRRDVVAAWAGAVAGGTPASHVEACVDALAPWGEAVGVGEPMRRRSDVLASSQVIGVLGPRPATPRALAIWQDAATQVARKQRHGCVKAELAAACRPGPRRDQLAALSTQELAGYLRLQRVVADARRRLGLDRTPTRRDAGRTLGIG